MAEKAKEHARSAAKRAEKASEKAEEIKVKFHYLISAERALFIQFFL
jgi:hypothetical protein